VENRISLIRLAMTLTRPLAVAVAAVAALSMSGYALGMSGLYRPLSDGPTSHPLTLLVTLVIAAALWLHQPGQRRWSCSLLAGIGAVLCLVRLASPADGSLLVAVTPFAEVVAADHAAGRANSMGMNTAVMFLGVALSIQAHWLGRSRASQILAFLTLGMPMVSVTGYAYGLPQFYGEMSLLTVTLGMPLGIAAAVMSAHRGLLRALLSPYVSGRIARVQIGLGYAFPLVTGYLLLRAVGDKGETGLFGVFVVSTSWFIILLVAVSAVVHERVDHRRRLFERTLARRATMDALTGTFNRRKIDLCLDEEMQRCRRSGREFSVTMFDIDFFKRVNDTGGHAVGDDVLRAVAAVAKANVRSTDIVGRLGGEEFAILLPETPLSGAVHVADQVRRAIAALALDPWPGHDGKITASFGCASSAACGTVQEMLERCDSAVYKAKAAGRNRVALAGPEGVSVVGDAVTSRQASAP
jgi:diguanylate cyclase (GGDEF)-like protein